jgi:hypothetical protein
MLLGTVPCQLRVPEQKFPPALCSSFYSGWQGTWGVRRQANRVEKKYQYRSAHNKICFNE